VNGWLSSASLPIAKKQTLEESKPKVKGASVLGELFQLKHRWCDNHWLTPSTIQELPLRLGGSNDYITSVKIIYKKRLALGTFGCCLPTSEFLPTIISVNTT